MSDLVIRGNSIYTIVDGPSWEEAQANSNKIGGDLASINDKEEDVFVWENIGINASIKGGEHNSYSSNHVFLGASDRNDEGIWKWLDGSDMSYSNWISNQPDNAGGEDYLSYLAVGGEDDKGTNSGLWNDVRSDYYKEQLANSHMYGISETKFLRYRDSAYVIVEGPTWEEAEANANKLGGHLVTINDADENKWIAEEFSKEKYYYDGDSNPWDPETWTHFWIGATDKNIEGSWEWSSGEEYSFSLEKWDQFKSWGINGPKYTQHPNRDYAAVIFNNAGLGDYYFTNGENKYDPNNNNNFKGIAEIKLPKNRIPTGDIFLYGDFKKGETIKLDSSEIEDLDNFEGYNPTFNYSWEISNNNGKSWTTLTSDDAIDNDNSFKITAEEEGFQIRGLVSYLDGYGTQETTISEAKLIKINEIYGGIGDDILIGGEVNDAIYGGKGNDEIYGGDGKDKLYGGRGKDYLKGNSGDDKLYGKRGRDALKGGRGDDYLSGGSGSDKLWGNSGKDKLYGGSSNDKLYGGDGKDVLKGGKGTDYLKGNSSADKLYGERGRDALKGGRGDDYLSGGSGSDKLWGNSGKDKLYGGSSNDKLYGGDGKDKLYGGRGKDYLKGNSGKDELYGGDGKDYLKGNSGDDILVGGLGKDKLYGGSGNDVFKLTEGDGYDRIRDFKKETDKIYIKGIKHLKIKDSGKHAKIYSGKDLLAVVYNEDDITKSGNYLI